MLLNLPTLMVMTLVNMFIALIAAIFVWRLNRPMNGLSTMVAGLGVLGLCFGISFLGKPMLGRAAGWCGNTGMVLGMFLILQGTLEFRGFTRFPFWAAALMALPFVLAQACPSFVHEPRTLRTSVFAFTIAGMCFAGARAMSCGLPHEDRLTYCVSAVGLLVYGLVQTLRGVWVLLPGQEHSIDGGWLPVLTLLTLNVCLIACLFGLSTATNLRLRKDIEKLAFCDPLTGLANRRSFDERLELVCARSVATGFPVALIYVDLDRFKSINDRFGHAAGDGALKEVALRLKSAVGDDDCLARIGGDEFVVLTERCADRAGALALIKRLQNSLLQPIMVCGSPVKLGVSCGVAFYPGDVANTADLIRKADAGMYAMKKMAALG